MSNTNFANGFNCFCTDCKIYFSVQSNNDDINAVEYCPYCGGHYVLCTTEQLLDYCAEYDVDPVNFYKAFPPDEPIPNSCTGATPRQVSLIIYLVTQRKDIPLTAESIAGNCETTIDLVRKVFEELHITEKRESK